MQRRESETTGARLFVFLTTLVVTCYPPLVSLLDEGLLGGFRYFAADSFYYLAIADHSVGAPFFTFDGIHPTNGFHPLWQLHLERGFALLGLDAANQIRFTAVSGIAFVSLGTAFFSLALHRITGRSWLALLGATPGLFYLLSPRLNPHHWAQWSFANGMESPLSILFFGVLCWLLVCRDGLNPATPPVNSKDSPAASRRILAVSLLVGLVILSRLDDVFLLVPMVALVALGAESRRNSLRRVVLVAALPSLMLVVYMLSNLSYAGSLLPSSGAAKVQPFFALARNLYATLTTLAPFADFMREGTSVWSSEAWRIFQMLVPMSVAAIWLATTRPSWRPQGEWEDLSGRQHPVIDALAVYVVLKTGFNFVMVGLWHQGQWYYPLCLMVANLIVITWIGRAIDSRGPVAVDGHSAIGLLAARWPTLTRAPLATIVTLGIIVVSANAYVEMKSSGGHQLLNYTFFEERSTTTALLEQSCPGCGVLAFDDGIVAYSLTSVPTMNGLGLVLDHEASAALEEGRLLDVAWERGNRLLVSVNYAMPAQAYESPEELARYLRDNRHLEKEALDRWSFSVAFQLPESGVSFVRFEPKPIEAR